MKAPTLPLACFVLLAITAQIAAFANNTDLPNFCVNQNTPSDATRVLNLIRNQRYNDALTLLERILEKDPKNGEALTYLATANLYLDRNFTKAKEEFDCAYQQGGGATFLVSHSHENVLAADEIVDYCRGWLHLRRSGIQFVPLEGDHGFNLAFSEVSEFKQNRFGKSLFHIKVGGKNQNFRGRTGLDLEALLIIAVYKSFQTK